MSCIFVHQLRHKKQSARTKTHLLSVWRLVCGQSLLSPCLVTGYIVYLREECLCFKSLQKQVFLLSSTKLSRVKVGNELYHDHSLNCEPELFFSGKKI